MNDSLVNPGDVVAGKYRVEREIGSGGMGVVVAARHIGLGHAVALKLMRPTRSGASAEAHERFLREGRASVNLRSHHVARALDVGTLDNGVAYMVMKYLDGADLLAVMEERGPLPVDEAVEYVLQACEAIAEAHAAGIDWPSVHTTEGHVVVQPAD